MYTVIFDLDGTISDPAEGITQSINYALVKLGYKSHPEIELLKYIGPQLNIAFSELTGMEDKNMLLKAIALYRERYIATGYRENRLYTGISDVLSKLSSCGSTLCIATAKRRDIASKVIKFLKIDGFFPHVHGCGLHKSKADLLKDILSDKTLNKNPMIMIGDRDTDFIAASAVNIPSIGVRWGYGEDKELALATDTVERPSELPEAIRKNVNQTRNSKT